MRASYHFCNRWAFAMFDRRYYEDMLAANMREDIAGLLLDFKDRDYYTDEYSAATIAALHARIDEIPTPLPDELALALLGEVT
jgi:hypothetical protein